MNRFFLSNIAVGPLATEVAALSKEFACADDVITIFCVGKSHIRRIFVAIIAHIPAINRTHFTTLLNKRNDASRYASSILNGRGQAISKTRANHVVPEKRLARYWLE